MLARHDMGQILAALPLEVRDYLKRNAEDVMSRFERSFRSRIPDYDDQYRNTHYDRKGGGGPATINLLRPPLDWVPDNQDRNRVLFLHLLLRPENYLLGGLDPDKAPQTSQDQYMLGMSTLPGLDVSHQQELGFALVVLEVRSYGVRHVSAADARAQHERLAAVVRELGARDQEIALAASVRQVIRESLARNPGTLQLTLAAPLVAGHERPGAIWQAALDFLRAEPAIASQIRFVEDAWRQDGQSWNLIPLPPEIRQLLGTGGPTVTAGNSTAGRDTHTSPDRVPEPAAVTSPQEVWAEAVTERTLSGWYVRPGGAGGHQGGARDLAAARLFPLVEDAVVVHAHTDPVTGLLAAGGELLTAEEFYARVLAPRMLRPGQRALEPGQLLVMVACGLAAARAGDLEAAAGVLARLGNWRVLAASADVFTTTGGRVVTARLGFGGDGRPVAGTAGPASWALFEPGAAEPRMFGPADLATPEDLAAVLALMMQLPGPLARAVRWAMDWA